VSGPSGGPWQVRFVGALGGTNLKQMTADGSGLTGSSPAIALATPSQGGDAGRVQQVTDPRGLVSKTDYDLKGRTLRTIENYVAFVPTATTDRTTQYQYDGEDHVTQLQAILPNNGVQITQYVYGINNSYVSTNEVVQKIQYPDKMSGQPSTNAADTETLNYNALEQSRSSDRNGTNHTFGYDVLSRPIFDKVAQIGTGVDGAVQRLDTAYDTGGRAYLFTSYADTAGNTVVNQVQRAFNGLGQLTNEYQSHSGAVVIGTTPQVQYNYTLMAGGVNNSRLVSMVYPLVNSYYPNGRKLRFEYNTGTGAAGLDDRISRLSFLADDNSGSVGTHLEDYSYLGLSTVVKRAHAQPGVDLTYIDPLGATGDAGDKYTGLDRFGRVVDQRWLVSNSTTNYADRFQYGFDRDSNRLYRNNLVNTAFGELYHTNGPSGGYDGFNELTMFARGVLTASNPPNGPLDTITSPAHSQGWTLDAMGNWSSFGSDATTQTRTHNQQNEITGVSGQTTPAYDNNGNMITDETGKQFVFDAWMS
jgi:YD repeat-containing protein